MYSIREISARFGLRASTIRYYEEIGLLENVIHEGYKRVYDESHIDRLGAIECFKKARLSLEEIKQFFAYEKDINNRSGDILEMMKAQERKTKEEMEKLRVGLEHVQIKIRYYSAVDEAIKEGRAIPAWSDIMK